MSVLFYKMRDANTNCLRWNVKLPITIQCLNQTTGKREREYTNGTDIIYSKPTNDLSSRGSSGKYLPHTELAEYVKNDSFSIRVTKFTVQ